MNVPLIEQITMHPAVSRAMSGVERTPALDQLVTLRKARRGVKRAASNQREEIAAYGRRRDAYDRGMVCEVPPMPSDKHLRLALEADGLPGELRALIGDYLAQAAPRFRKALTGLVE